MVNLSSILWKSPCEYHGFTPFFGNILSKLNTCMFNDRLTLWNPSVEIHQEGMYETRQEIINDHRKKKNYQPRWVVGPSVPAVDIRIKSANLQDLFLDFLEQVLLGILHEAG